MTQFPDMTALPWLKLPTWDLAHLTPDGGPHPGTQATALLWRIATEAPVVMGIRLWQMACAGAFPSANDRREMKRMTSEKVAAAAESTAAMAGQVMALNMSLAMNWPMLAVDASSRRRFADASSRVLEKGLEPIQKRVSANSRRLTRGALQAA